jgi:hypothetical protein
MYGAGDVRVEHVLDAGLVDPTDHGARDPDVPR